MKMARKPAKTTAKKDAAFKTFPLVVIDWQDAVHATDTGWQRPEEFKAQLVASQAAGYLVFDGKNEWGEDVVTISAAITYHIDSMPSFCESFTLPKKMILKMTVIKSW